MQESEIILNKDITFFMDYAGSDDDTWEYFPCPFCNVDVEIPSLCSHLQEEHCFDMKNTV